MVFALQAAVTKVFTTELGHGLAALPGDWAVYALIASAAAGFVLQQSALKTGVLAPAMAASNTVTLLASVILGLAIFGETLSHGHGRLAPAIIGLATAVTGIAMLARPGRAEQQGPGRAPAPPARAGQDQVVWDASRFHPGTGDNAVDRVDGGWGSHHGPL